MQSNTRNNENSSLTKLTLRCRLFLPLHESRHLSSSSSNKDKDKIIKCDVINVGIQKQTNDSKVILQICRFKKEKEKEKEKKKQH